MPFFDQVERSVHCTHPTTGSWLQRAPIVFQAGSVLTAAGILRAQWIIGHADVEGRNETRRAMGMDPLAVVGRINEGSAQADVAGAQLGSSLHTHIQEWLADQVAIKLLCDNSAVISIVGSGASSTARTRHLAMRAAYLHALHGDQDVPFGIEYVDTKAQKADALTKGLSSLADQARACKDLCLVAWQSV